VAEPITFYFDFSSPYGYLAAEQIAPIAARHRREVLWRPILLGAIFKTSGGKPLAEFALKWSYAQHELARSARRHTIPFVVPTPFPFLTLAASRAFYWLETTDPKRAAPFARAVFRGAFAEGRDMSLPIAVAGAAALIGIDDSALMEAIDDQRWKDRLRAETDQALARGVFGSPFFLIDGEPFWGVERLSEIDAWLGTGGW
jgi:2-hydroxychromene-2-carboxylate isomerase